MFSSLPSSRKVKIYNFLWTIWWRHTLVNNLVHRKLRAIFECFSKICEEHSSSKKNFFDSNKSLFELVYVTLSERDWLCFLTLLTRYYSLRGNRRTLAHIWRMNKKIYKKNHKDLNKMYSYLNNILKSGRLCCCQCPLV